MPMYSRCLIIQMSLQFWKTLKLIFAFNSFSNLEPILVCMNKWVVLENTYNAGNRKVLINHLTTGGCYEIVFTVMFPWHIAATRIYFFKILWKFRSECYGIFKKYWRHVSSDVFKHSDAFLMLVSSTTQ